MAKYGHKVMPDKSDGYHATYTSLADLSLHTQLEVYTWYLDIRLLHVLINNTVSSKHKYMTKECMYM